MNITRRGLIKGLAAVAALAVAPSIVSKEKQRTEFVRVMEKARDGIISGETFYLDGPVVIEGVRGLSIIGCTFIYRRAVKCMLEVNDCKNLLISDSTFIDDSFSGALASKYPDSMYTI